MPAQDNPRHDPRAHEKPSSPFWVQVGIPIAIVWLNWPHQPQWESLLPIHCWQGYVIFVHQC
jgi:hypothetical protein